MCGHFWCQHSSSCTSGRIEISFFLFQFADSDDDESGSVFQVVGHGGRGPPHVPDHKASAEGEERGQVG